MREDPAVALKQAIAKLAEFTVAHAPANHSSLQKTVGLVRSFFLSKPKTENLSEVKRAIDILKSNYRLIEKWSSGSPQEQKLAASATAVIAQYNSIIETVRQKPKSLNARINHFLLKKSGQLLPRELAQIHLPKMLSLQIRYQEGGVKRISASAAVSSQKVSHQKVSHLGGHLLPLIPLSHCQVAHLSRQTLELFQMKAISLIEQHALLSNSDARTAMRKAQLQSSVENDACMVSCTLSPFPGHAIAISGVFERRGENFVLPKNESFHLTLTALHTGFPYPSQYTGWALSDLSPPYPHCLDDLPLFKPLYQQKLAAAQRLQPNQERVGKVKQIAQQKKESVQGHQEQYLDLQQELCLAIARASSEEEVPKQVQEAIAQFFAKLKQLQHVFDYYAETQQLINESFVGRPLAKLEAAWLEKQKDVPALAILGSEADRAKQELIDQKALAKSDLEKCTLEFIISMGSLLAAPCHRILLQHFSELRFAPPMLDDFEQKLQMALYRQLQAFLKELESDLAISWSQIEEQIKADTALFQAKAIDDNDPAAQIVNELEGYFNGRYYAMLRP